MNSQKSVYGDRVWRLISSELFALGRMLMHEITKERWFFHCGVLQLHVINNKIVKGPRIAVLFGGNSFHALFIYHTIVSPL